MARHRSSRRHPGTPPRPGSPSHSNTSLDDMPAVTEWPRAAVSLRLIALVYDGLLLVAMTAVVNTLLIAAVTPDAAASRQELTVLPAGVRDGLLLPATVLVAFLFYGYCWTRSGQTLGMQTWRLALRRRDGRLPTWADSARRFAAAALVPALCGGASWLLRHDTTAFALSVLTGFVFNYAWQWLPLRQRLGNLHDTLSETEVLRHPVPPRSRKPYRFLGLFGDRREG